MYSPAQEVPSTPMLRGAQCISRMPAQTPEAVVPNDFQLQETNEDSYSVPSTPVAPVTPVSPWTPMSRSLIRSISRASTRRYVYQPNMFESPTVLASPKEQVVPGTPTDESTHTPRPFSKSNGIRQCVHLTPRQNATESPTPCTISNSQVNVYAAPVAGCSGKQNVAAKDSPVPPVSTWPMVDATGDHAHVIPHKKKSLSPTSDDSHDTPRSSRRHRSVRFRRRSPEASLSTASTESTARSQNGAEYMVCEIEVGKKATLPDINDGVIYRAIIAELQKLHGDYLVASVKRSPNLSVKYLNKDTNLVLLRCERGVHKYVQSTIPFVNSLKSVEMFFNTIHTAGTIRSCLKFLVRHYKMKLTSMLPQCTTNEEKEKVKALMVAACSESTRCINFMGRKKQDVDPSQKVS